ncbi:uncharacterized protein IL334_001338 [Kwoniella shivajii]|uniref:Zn(2)-C6 fungal-type domain-containing protein n=1 Tax=Kwoniella shivajii TaxID=564305 RepID=A0ABZ1CRN7_9TREE|nr:hypothetical protein IL334_001338 [Kwoniella shivajii]
MGPSAPRVTDIPLCADSKVLRGSACEGCKVRKVRCGAEKPSCLTCMRHGKKCQYPPPKTGHRIESSIEETPITRPDSGNEDQARVHDQHASSPSTHSQTVSVHPTLHIPTIQSFQPSVGTEGDQPLPELDLSWLLDTPISTSVSGEGQEPPPFDAAAKDHCLWLYFTNQTASGLEMNIARFYERLASPDPGQKPHPALLNAMVKSETGINSALKDLSTLGAFMLDLMRACILLAEWLWGQGREAEAIVMSSTACRFAAGACLDQIPSSTLHPCKRVYLRRQRRPMAGWPKDIVELADSIYAFWSVVLLDLCASIATGLPAQFDPRSIRTPLPKPWSTYGEPFPQPDRYISDLFSTSSSSSATQSDFLQLYESPEKRFSNREGIHTSIDEASSYSSEILASTVSACPPIFLLSEAIERFASRIPPHLKTMHTVVEGVKMVSSPAMTLHFILCAARMFAADLNSYDVPNDAAINQVRRMVDSMRLMAPMDLANMSLSIYTIWVLAAQILMREVKRLNRQGEFIAVAALDSDIDLIIQTLTVVAMHSPLVQGEIGGLAQLRAAPPSDVDPDEDVMRSESHENPTLQPDLNSLSSA